MASASLLAAAALVLAARRPRAGPAGLPALRHHQRLDDRHLRPRLARLRPRRADREPARRRRHHLPPARAPRASSRTASHTLHLGPRQARASPPRATPTAPPTPGARSTLGDARQARVAFHLPYLGYGLATLSERRCACSSSALPALLIALTRWPGLWRDSHPGSGGRRSRHDPARRPARRRPGGRRCGAGLRRRRSPRPPANPGASFATAANFPPAVTLTAPADGAATNGTTPTLSGAAGNSTGDSPTVNVKIYSGSTATGTAVQTKAVTRSTTTWTWTTDHGAGPGHLHRPGHADRHRRQHRHDRGQHLHGRRDQARPPPSVAATNKTGGTAGKIENGDTLTFTYSEPITAASVWSGWSGASTPRERDVHQRHDRHGHGRHGHHGHRSSSAASRPTATT